MCADDDRDTEARADNTPGRDKTVAVAGAGLTGQGVAAAATLVEAAAADLVPQAAQPAAGDNARPAAETGPGAATREADNVVQGQPSDNNASSTPASPKRLHRPRDASAPGTHRQSDPRGAAPPQPDPL